MSSVLGAASSLASQREMERQILKLLHRAKRPEALGAIPIMASVCREMGTSNPIAALEQIVQTALAGDDERAATLRNVILEADFKRTASNGELARRSGVSRRHFQRWRAQAVASIARYAGGILQPCTVHEEERASIRSQPKDAAWRFKRETAAFFCARDRGSALEMRCIAKNMLRLAQGEGTRTVALTCLADANLRLGKAEPGDELHLRRAVSRPQSFVWAAVANDVDRARRSMRKGEICAAEKQARSTWERSESLDFQGLSARSAAILHAGAQAGGRIGESNEWRARAVERLLFTQDRTLATDLFLNAAYDERRPMDPALNEVLYERLCIVMPQMLGESAEQHAAMAELLAAILEPPHSPSGPSRLASAVASVTRADSAFAHYAEKLLDPVAEMLALAAAALSGLSWEMSFEGVRLRLADCAARLRPATLRTIAVAVPRCAKSQSVLPDHFRVDDQRSTGVEDLAGLHLRILSFRSGTRTAHARRRGEPVAGPPGAAAGALHSC